MLGDDRSFQNGTYDVSAVAKLNSNIFSTTRGNKYKLKSMQAIIFEENFPFCSQLINVWYSLPDSVVDADTINTFKSRPHPPTNTALIKTLFTIFIPS